MLPSAKLQLHKTAQNTRPAEGRVFYAIAIAIERSIYTGSNKSNSAKWFLLRIRMKYQIPVYASRACNKTIRA